MSSRRDHRLATLGVRHRGRRAFLAAGGALVALPFLGSLALEGQARAQTPSPLKRLVLMFSPNGSLADDFFPTTRAPTDWDLSTILSPLSKHKERLTIIGGMANAVSKDSRFPGGPHARGMGSLFTGRELQEGTMRSNDGRKAGWANGPSIDRLVANRIGQGSPISSLALAVGTVDTTMMARMSYSGPGEPVTPQTDPSAVHNMLLTRFPDTTATADAGAEQRTAERRLVLDAVGKQFEALKPQLSASDRDKLDAHSELLVDVERRLNFIANPSGACAEPERPPALNPTGEDDLAQIADLQVDMIATAFACDITRVASLQLSDAFNKIRYPWADSKTEGHALSHKNEDAEIVRTERIAKEQWHAAVLNRLMDRLAALPDGEEGSLLDGTLIVWGTEVAYGYTHGHENMPLVLAGGAGGQLRMGESHTFAGRPHNDLLLTILRAYGLEDTTVGHPDFNTGLLDALLT